MMMTNSNTLRFATLLVLALRQPQVATGFSTPSAHHLGGSFQSTHSIVSLSSKAIIANNGINHAASSFNARHVPLLHKRDRRSGGLQMSEGGEAAAAVPPEKRGFIEKVSTYLRQKNAYEMSRILCIFLSLMLLLPYH